MLSMFFPCITHAGGGGEGWASGDGRARFVRTRGDVQPQPKTQVIVILRYGFHIKQAQPDRSVSDSY